MKSSGYKGKQRIKNCFHISAAVALAVVGMTIGSAWAAGEGGVHWQDTDWFRIMNFAVLAAAIYVLLRKPVSQALNGRIKGIVQELEELEARKQSIEKQLSEYDARMAMLDKEAETILAEYQRQGEEAKARILREAEAAADKLKEQAGKNIEYEFKQARLALQEGLMEKALARAEQLIAEKITPDDQNRLVNEYLDKVVA
jgi:F-type H+-transporting ATPase subunit b